MKKSLFVLLSIFFFTAGSLFAEKITFSADSMAGTAGSKTDSTTLSGNAEVKTSTMEIKADSIVLSGEDFRYITAEGKVEGINSESQMDFTCSKLRYDRNTKLAQLEGSVHLIDKANDVTADAQLIEYNQQNETAIMQINVSLKQKNNTCTSAYAIYRKSQQLLEMSGNPKIIQGEDSFRAQEISLNLESQEITLDGRVRGTVSDSKPEAKTDENNSSSSEVKDVTPSEDENDAASDSESKDSTDKTDSDSVTKGSEAKPTGTRPEPPKEGKIEDNKTPPEKPEGEDSASESKVPPEKPAGEN